MICATRFHPMRCALVLALTAGAAAATAQAPPGNASEAYRRAAGALTAARAQMSAESWQEVLRHPEGGLAPEARTALTAALAALAEGSAMPECRYTTADPPEIVAGEVAALAEVVTAVAAEALTQRRWDAAAHWTTVALRFAVHVSHDPMLRERADDAVFDLTSGLHDAFQTLYAQDVPPAAFCATMRPLWINVSVTGTGAASNLKHAQEYIVHTVAMIAAGDYLAHTGLLPKDLAEIENVVGVTLPTCPRSGEPVVISPCAGHHIHVYVGSLGGDTRFHLRRGPMPSHWWGGWIWIAVWGTAGGGLVRWFRRNPFVKRDLRRRGAIGWAAAALAAGLVAVEAVAVTQPDARWFEFVPLGALAFAALVPPAIVLLTLSEERERGTGLGLLLTGARPLTVLLGTIAAPLAPVVAAVMGVATLQPIRLWSMVAHEGYPISSGVWLNVLISGVLAPSACALGLVAALAVGAPSSGRLRAGVATYGLTFALLLPAAYLLGTPGLTVLLTAVCVGIGLDVAARRAEQTLGDPRS